MSHRRAEVGGINPAIMRAVRDLVRRYSSAVAVLYALALAMRIAVPGGFMPTMSDGRMVVSICSGTMTKTMVIEIPGLKKPLEKSGHSRQVETCVYAGLTMAAVGEMQPELLAGILHFAKRLGYEATPLSLALGRSGLPPWSRGPPTLI